MTSTESATITVAARATPATLIALPDSDRAESGITTIDARPARDASTLPKQSEPARTAPARVIKGRFKLLNSLGKGGMGTVYRAVDLLKQEAGDKTPYVAVKLLNDNISKMDNALRIMQRETKNSQELSHPNIIKVFDFDRDGNDLYMTMELLEGKPLDAAIQAGGLGELGVPALAKVIEQMSAGLAYAHEKGVIHCDFKPGNVFLLADGQVKVLDFGIARFAQGVTESAGDTLFGYTPRYASAEIMQMLPAHPADDVYALACVAYEVLSGKHPFDGANIVEAEREAREPARLPNLKRHQWQAIQRGLAFKKEARLQSAAEFLKEFHGRPNWLLYGAIAATMTAVIGTGAWYGGLASSDPADAIAPELRAVSTARATQAVSDLTKFHSRPLPFLYPKAMQAFGEALKANPYNKPALAALEAEAKILVATTPPTEADRQDLNSKLQGMLEIEAVPLRKELQAKQDALRLQ